MTPLALPAQDNLLFPNDPLTLDGLMQPRLALFWGSHTPTRTLLTALTALASRGAGVRVFDGGNRFDGYFVARLARRLSSRPEQILKRIRISRAFTCFQLAELIENSPAAADPVFVLDLLSTFYDESVPLADSERLLGSTIAHLRRLAASGPVVVGAREPRTLVKDRWTLLEQLQAGADSAWLLRAPVETALQPRLF
ncbi:MAG: hypothetical protein JXA25_04360 [Anaerolineales bacterium]|nr:hypothetical protein [Anaerolineales bacterium]